MEFRLTYMGKLPSQNSQRSRLAEKHAIRRYLHTQLKTLWSTDRFLVAMDNEPSTPDGVREPTASEELTGQFGCVPLIGSKWGTACSLDILFLRRDFPGDIVWKGDIDNRIKVLLDALHIPQEHDPSMERSGEGEDPLYVLLEDDKLIVDLRVVTDRLLGPIDPRRQEKESDVYLVIHVKAITIDETRKPSFWT